MGKGKSAQQNERKQRDREAARKRLREFPDKSAAVDLIHELYGVERLKVLVEEGEAATDCGKARLLIAIASLSRCELDRLAAFFRRADALDKQAADEAAAEEAPEQAAEEAAEEAPEQ